MKQFEIMERETIITTVTIEAESIEAYKAGNFTFIEHLDSECIDCEILEIKEIEE